MKTKILATEFIFYASYIPWIIINMILATDMRNYLPNDGVPVYRAVLIWTFSVAILKIAYERLYQSNQLVGVSLLGLLLLISSFLTSEDNLIVNFTLVFAAGNLNIKRIINISAVVMAMFMIGTHLGYVTGLFEDFIVLRDVDGMRHSLGYTFTTFAANYFFHFVLLYIYGRKQQIMISELFMLAVINYYLYAKTDTKSAYFLTTLTLFVAFIGIMFKPKDWLKHNIRQVAKWSVVWGSIGSIGIVYIYRYMWYNGALIRLNNMLSGRLYYGKIGLERYGLSLFGQSVEWIAYGQDQPYFFIDGSFLNISIQYGFLLLLMLMIAVFMVVTRYHYHDGYFQIVLIILVGHSMFDPQFLELWYNPFLLFLGQLVYPRRHRFSLQ